MTVPLHRACYTVRLNQSATPLSFAYIGGRQKGPTSVLSTTGFYGVMQQRFNQSWVHNVDEVKQRLMYLGDGMNHSAIDNAVDE